MDQALDYLSTNYWPVATIALGFIIIGLIADKLSTRRDKPMLTKEQMAADLICNAFEDAIHTHKLEREYVVGLYHAIGAQCGLKDLLSIANRKHQDLVKQAIKARRANGANRPVILPGASSPKVITRLSELPFIRKQP